MFPAEYFAVKIDYFVHRRCTPTWRIVKDRISFFDLTYLTGGGALYTIDGVTHELSSGDLLCLPPGHFREAQPVPENPMHCFAVNFWLWSLDGRQPREIQRLPFPLVSRVGMRKDLLRLFQELDFAWLGKEPGFQVRTQGILLEILHLLFEQIVYKIDPEVGDWRIKKVCSYIGAHYAEKLQMPDFAALTGLNTVYFGALFKKETGMSVRQYIAKTRVTAGENLLRSGEYTVKETAEYCGYRDVFHFYKQFKGLLGFAPSSCIPKRDKRR